MITFFYSIILILFSIYSYALVDLNLTLINHPLWSTFREQIIQIGYFKRDISWHIYLLLVLLLIVFNFIFLKKYKEINILKIALITGVITLFSYPFLSHDFFNYLFDAKILTFYHKNPYLFTALDFPNDHWTRFMHWTHRTYPYGPTFLFITIIPSFLSFGKFVLSFFFFKLTFFFFYFISTFLLNKINKQYAVFFAVNPLVIIEGLNSLHNDLIAVSLSIIGIYFLLKNKNKGKKILGRLFLLFSAGIKYMTLPLLFLKVNSKNTKCNINLMILISTLIVLAHLTFYSEIQPWYFLILFAFLPFYYSFIKDLFIFFAGLLFSYYPYIRLGGWDTKEKVELKHLIILIFFLINVIYLIYLQIVKKKRIVKL